MLPKEPILANRHPAVGSKSFARLKLDILRRHPAGNILIICALLEIACILGSVVYPDQFRYLSPLNVQSVLRAVPQLGIIAIGIGILMIAGEYDLSVGATFTLSALTMTNSFAAGMPLPVAVAIGLMTGNCHRCYQWPDHAPGADTVFYRDLGNDDAAARIHPIFLWHANAPISPGARL
jgi:hypothetical protein